MYRVVRINSVYEHDILFTRYTVDFFVIAMFTYKIYIFKYSLRDQIKDV